MSRATVLLDSTTVSSLRCLCWLTRQSVIISVTTAKARGLTNTAVSWLRLLHGLSGMARVSHRFGSTTGPEITNTWPSSCWPATSNSTPSIRVFYQSASTVPCCIHLVLPLTRSSKRCHVAAINVHSSTVEYNHNAPVYYTAFRGRTWLCQRCGCCSYTAIAG